MRYARLSAQVDGAAYPCRAQGVCARRCSRSRNLPTDVGGAVPPTPRYGRDTRVGSSRSAAHMGSFVSRALLAPGVVQCGSRDWGSEADRPLEPVFCSELEGPFFVPSPTFRIPERAEGVKGPKR